VHQAGLLLLVVQLLLVLLVYLLGQDYQVGQLDQLLLEFQDYQDYLVFLGIQFLLDFLLILPIPAILPNPSIPVHQEILVHQLHLAIHSNQVHLVVLVILSILGRLVGQWHQGLHLVLLLLAILWVLPPLDVLESQVIHAFLASQ